MRCGKTGMFIDHFSTCRSIRALGGRKFNLPWENQENRAALELGTGTAAKGSSSNAGRLYPKVPSNKREVSEGETQACRVETEKLYSKTF